ncbi:hypothetical protein AN642_01655 [Epulopiscium sp. SCG-B10WGA-EpuloA2]|nr:hypothetical protein AN642_01655 [Epulopiscium sp. SCG-B10WGA-EpuloA2]
MLVRILTGIIGIPFVLWILISGSFIMQMVGIVIGAIAIMEYFKAVSSIYKPMNILGFLLITGFFAFFSFFIEYYQVYISLVLLSVLIYGVLTYPKYTITDIAATIFGVIYIGLLFGLIICIRRSDTCAYFVESFIENKISSAT